MDNMKTGQFIRDLRKERGMTQRELADRLHITDRAVSKWERGVSQIERYQINPTLTFAQPILPERWITRKGGMHPAEGARTAFSWCARRRTVLTGESPESAR